MIAREAGASFMVDMAHMTGLVAAGVVPNPVPHADFVTASGAKTMCGPHCAFILCRAARARELERAVYPGIVASVHMQSIAALAIALGDARADYFRDLMRRTVKNAKCLARALGERGFEIVTGGTDCHMLLAGARPLGTDGETLADNLDRAGVYLNSKSIPHDPSPRPSGIRLGTTVCTQRGMGPNEMESIADILLNSARGRDVQGEARELAQEFNG